MNPSREDLRQVVFLICAILSSMALPSSSSSEEGGSRTDSIDLKTYPDDQTIPPNHEVVFQCRDEGTIMAAVHWLRDGNRPMPPGTRDVHGRLTIPNVQVEHSGVYYCEASGVPQSTPGRRKTVTLNVNPYVAPTPPTSKPVCGVQEIACMDRQCISRDKICNGVFDCEDSSDELRCNPLGCEPNEYKCDNYRCVLKTWMCDSDDDCGDGSDERDCVTNPPDAPCRHNEFTCQVGEYCIPKSLHCDGEVDCQDGSDETGCSKPTIVVPPPRNLMLQVSQTIIITCTAIGVPMPIVSWRLNWGHVPNKCRMTSVDGYGVLTCPNAQPTDQGAYSCEAINSLGSVFATPDCIIQIEGGSPVCQPPQFNTAAYTPQDCLQCFCFGATEQCYSTDRYITQLPPPRSESYQLVGVNQDRIQGNYVIRDKTYPLSSRFLQPQYSNNVQLGVDRTKLGVPSDLLVYFSMPNSHKGQRLSSYGGLLKYTIQYSSQGAGQPISGPDVIIRGNDVTLMHVHDGSFRPGKENQVDVKFTSGYWFKRVIGRGRLLQTQEPASREDIMMVLGNMDLLLIRALYHDGSFVDTTLSKVQLDTAVISSSDQGRAVYVEECRCPSGYVGLSCQACAPNYKRIEEGLGLGRCVLDAECKTGEYGDPANGIACQPCPCPLTTPTNQFSSSCYLDNDRQVTCNCLQGYRGRHCERCSEGYNGNPYVPGDSCKPGSQPEPPRVNIEEPREVVELKRGETLEVSCSAVGNPRPQVNWSYGLNRERLPINVFSQNGVLIFRNVQSTVSGEYYCTATNSQGIDYARITITIVPDSPNPRMPSPSPEGGTLIIVQEIVELRSGETVRVSCIAGGSSPTTTITWSIISGPLSSQAVTASGELHIVNPRPVDSSVYVCRIIDDNTYEENDTNITITENVDHPSVSIQPDKQTIKQGTNAELRCIVSGDPTPVITWSKVNEQFGTSVSVEGSILRITNAIISDRGTYICSAKNDGGTAQAEAIVEVEPPQSVTLDRAPPYITLYPAHQEVLPGNDASISCSATGSKPITINWSKDEGYMSPSVIINGGVMTIPGIKTADAGRYVCEAINSAGTTRAFAEIVVYEELHLIAIQQNVMMYVGQTAELRCEGSGITPNSTIQWKRVDGGLPPGAQRRGNLLILPFIQPEDSGRYVCEAITDTNSTTSDVITLTVQSRQTVDVRIESSRKLVRLEDDVVLKCFLVDDPKAAVSWSRVDKALPSNAVATGGQLRISSVQEENAGVYLCTVITQHGVFEKGYHLAIQGPLSSDDVYFSGVNTRSVKTRSVAFGSGVVMECHVNLPPPVSYTWTKQEGELPLGTLLQNSKLDIPEVHAEHAGLYICTGSNYERNIERPTLLVVTGVIPRFTGSLSYVTLSTLPRAYHTFDLDISFKPESADGLILYNSQRARSEDGDFISFGMSAGHAEFRFDIGSGPVVIRSSSPVELNSWHTVRLSRNRKEGTMIVDDGTPVTGLSDGRFIGLDLVENIYLGSVPDFSKVHKYSGFDTGFRGCISRLVIGKTVTVDLMRDAKTKVAVGECETCVGNPCQNSGVCQEAYTDIGHKCICPADFSGGLCEHTDKACYPGVCGPGRCIMKPGGFRCLCPFGKVGTHCEQDITIVEPAFGDGAYIAYPTPRALRHFSVDLSFKPENMNDGLLMYCAQKETGKGDFTSLAIRNKHVEYRFNTGSGTAILQSDPIQPGQWIHVRASRTDRFGSMSVNGGQMQSTESPGSHRGLNLVTLLFIGGIDQSRIKISPDVAVNQGFQGCVKQIRLMDQDIRLAESLIDSANVGQCGGTSASRCQQNPCGGDRGQCLDNPALPHGYSCTCNEGYSGRDCEIESGVCSSIQPCRNGGACVDSGVIYRCQCPIGFAGQHCEHGVEEDT